MVEEEEVQAKIFKLGVVLSYNAHQYPYVQVDVVQANQMMAGNAYINKIERFDLSRFINTTELFSEEDKVFYNTLENCCSLKLAVTLTGILRSAVYGKILYSSMMIFLPGGNKKS